MEALFQHEPAPIRQSLNFLHKCSYYIGSYRSVTIYRPINEITE
jgi:hypothetical protein